MKKAHTLAIISIILTVIAIILMVFFVIEKNVEVKTTNAIYNKDKNTVTLTPNFDKESEGGGDIDINEIIKISNGKILNIRNTVTKKEIVDPKLFLLSYKDPFIKYWVATIEDKKGNRDTIKIEIDFSNNLVLEVFDNTYQVDKIFKIVSHKNIEIKSPLLPDFRDYFWYDKDAKNDKKPLLDFKNYKNGGFLNGQLPLDSKYSIVLFGSSPNALLDTNSVLAFVVEKNSTLDQNIKSKNVSYPLVTPKAGYELSKNLWDFDINKELVGFNILIPTAVSVEDINYSFKVFYRNQDGLIQTDILGIENPITITGKIGQTINIQQPTIENYTLDPNNTTSVTITKNNKDIYISYLKNDELNDKLQYKIKYYLENSQTLIEGLDDYVSYGSLNDKISPFYKFLLGYKPVENTYNFTLTQNNQEFIIYYTKIDNTQSLTYITKYVDFETKKDILTSKTEVINNTSQFILDEIEIEGYQRRQNPLMQINENTITITILYDKINSQWANLSFDLGKFGTSTEFLTYNMLKKYPINSPKQLTPITKTPNVVVSFGHVLDKFSTVDNINFDIAMQIDKDMIFIARYSINNTNNYNVTINYYLENSTTKLADSNTTTKTLKEALELEIPTILNYELSNKQYDITNNNDNIEINIYFSVKKDSMFEYEINYLIQGSNTPIEGYEKVVQTATYNSTIKPNIVDIKGFNVVDNNYILTITQDRQQNILNIYYTVDTNYQEFEYKVLLTDSSDEKTLKIISGKSYANNTIDLSSQLIFDGYELVNKNDTTVTVSRLNNVEKIIYLRKDDTQFIKIEFELDNMAKSNDRLVYLVLKKYPLNSDKQHIQVIDPNVVANFGYKLSNTKWTPELDLNKVYDTNQVFNLNVEVNEDVELTYYVRYVLEGTNFEINPRTKHLGLARSIQTIAPLEINGYTIAEGQPSTITLTGDIDYDVVTLNYRSINPNKIIINFVVDNILYNTYIIDKLTTLASNSIVIPTIKNSDIQGYTASWPNIDLNIPIAGNTSFNAILTVDTTQKFNYKVISIDNKTGVLINSQIRSGYIGENITITPSKIDGYIPLADEYIGVVLRDGSTVITIAYQAK